MMRLIIFDERGAPNPGIRRASKGAAESKAGCSVGTCGSMTSDAVVVRLSFSSVIFWFFLH